MNNLPVVRSPWRILILVLGFTFLYAPMLMLVNLLVQQLQARYGLGWLVNSLVYSVIP
ncbi:ABC-type spermidine/putrescine transport system permease subunit II [Ewingella americana]